MVELAQSHQRVLRPGKRVNLVAIRTSLDAAHDMPALINREVGGLNIEKRVKVGLGHAVLVLGQKDHVDMLATERFSEILKAALVWHSMWLGLTVACVMGENRVHVDQGS